MRDLDKVTLAGLLVVLFSVGWMGGTMFPAATTTMTLSAFAVIGILMSFGMRKLTEKLFAFGITMALLFLGGMFSDVTRPFLQNG